MTKAMQADGSRFSKKLLLILNPAAGRQSIVRHIPKIIEIYQNAGYLVNTMVTQKPGDGREFARNYGGDYDFVVCTGGDGSLNETVSGLVEAGLDVPLSYIPCGSTNVFAESFGLPSFIPAAARAGMNGAPHSYDIGRFGDEYFCFVAAFGAFSWLSYTTDQNLKNLLGKTAYVLEGVKDLPAIRSVHMRFDVDGSVFEDDYLFGAVTNCVSLGGIFELPRKEVVHDDGLMELFLVRNPKNLEDLNRIIYDLIFQNYTGDYIQLIHCRNIEIENPGKVEFSLDGEKSRALEHIDISVLPGRLRMTH